MKPAATPHAFDQRRSGILLHPSSLPGGHGSGDLGPEAHRFLEFLAAGNQSWWQMLPVGPPGRGPAYSPYDSASAFAGSPWLVSLRTLSQNGLLASGDLRPAPDLSVGRINFAATFRYREDRLGLAFAAFRGRRGERGREFRVFREANADWLEDYALFAALRRDSGGKPWTEWPAEVRARHSSALRVAGERLAEAVAAQRFVQFAFARQWRALQDQARRRGIGLIGDLPIFVAHDSADVWCHQPLFQLQGNGQPRRVSGYPPDRFSPHGQLWGHPQYRWTVHEETGFAWWVQRFTRMFERFDAVRIDHFLGFTRTWSIPAGAASARSGRWVKSPGFELFAAVERRLGRRPMIAEDLGHVTPADVRLRDSFGLAPMRLFQFGFGTESDSIDHLPHNYSRLCAAYPGNHDNDTTVGWFQALSRLERRRVQAYTGGQPATFHRDTLRALFASPANLVICPLQDVLGLDSGARMNVPGTVEGNWNWRMPALPSAATGQALRSLTEVFGRGPDPRPPGKVGRHRMRPHIAEP